VYHKPPESFVGKGRFGADEIQRAAIQEQRQNAAENPIAASVAAAAGSSNGNSVAPQSNVENLLDIDFDGAAPASAEQIPAGTGTPDRSASPAVVGSVGAPTSSSAADIMGLFDAGPSKVAPGSNLQIQGGATGGGVSGILNDFAGMDLSGTSGPPPPGQQLGHLGPDKKNANAGDDLLGLF
jgi:hypothetical protein